MLDAKFYLSLIVACGMCLYAIYRGFIFLKQKGIIADTPTSKIQTAAIGSSVEIKGRCVAFSGGHSIVSPLLGKKCIAYAWTIEEYKKSGKNSKWVHTGSFYSDQYLKIKDRSGKAILVRFDELNLDFWRTKKKANLKSFFSKSHQGIVDTIKRYPELSNYIRRKEILGAFRVHEYTIMPFHNIYLLGEAAPVGQLEDILTLDLKKVVLGDESNFKSYKEDLSDIQFMMKKSQKFGDILKIEEVFASNYRESELIRKVALKAYALILGGIIGLGAISFFALNTVFFN